MRTPAVILCLWASVLGAAPVSFKSDIAPLLRTRCESCHGAGEAKGDYRVDSFAELMRGLEGEPARVLAGKPGESIFFKLLKTDDADERMPQKSEPLSAKQVALIQRWIAEGAKFDGSDPKAPLVQVIPARQHAAAPKSYPRPLPVTALAFSPDGKQLAVSGLREVTLWNADEGKLSRRIANMAQRTFALAWQGDTIFAGGGIPGELGEVRAFDAKKGALRGVIHQAGDLVMDAQLDVNGTMLAVADADNRITIFNTADLSQRLQIDNHSDWVMAVAFSADNRHLASASRDRTAKIFELKSGLAISTYGGHGAGVQGVAFRADGKQVFSSGRDKKIHVWKAGLADIEGKRFGAEKISEIAGFGREVFKITLANGMLFTPGADGHARQHAAADRKLIREYDGGGDWTLSLAHHAKTGRLAVGGYSGKVRVFDTKDGRLLRQFVASPAGE